jgi:hypothetical protein
MSKRVDKPCGCAYISPAGPFPPRWWQVIACPDHEMITKPLEEVPA